MVNNQDVLEILRDVQEKGGFRVYSAYSEAYNRIAELPDARPTAKWIQEKNTIYCSGCSARLNEYQYEFGAHRYCPSCGAYMTKH